MSAAVICRLIAHLDNHPSALLCLARNSLAFHLRAPTPKVSAINFLWLTQKRKDKYTL
jgi:hypothetical protein